MQKIILVAVGCLFIGFFAGFFVSNSINRNANLQATLPEGHGDAPILNQQTQVVSVKEPNAAPLPEVTETLDKAKKEPENFDAQMKAGDLYRKIRGFERAVEFYNNAAALKPTEYEKIVQLGNAYFDIGQFEKAELFYTQALAKKPDDVGVRTDLGITFVERQNPDYDRAIKEFQNSLATNSKHEPTIYNIAIAYYKKGDTENAQKYAAQLEQINPKSELNAKLKQLFSEK
jgi:tetratricopeptide (TPR) repeat protein